MAQKLAIRLNHEYDGTTLIHINAATVLSKFFSESAKHIFELFLLIESVCREDPRHLVCVLIDEIESLAYSRTTASNRGEVQDSIRATNALLTGFDRTRSQPNLVILCTSNMVDTLDPAFLDRCGHTFVIPSPSVEARFQILRAAVSDLVTSGVIHHQEPIPSFRNSQLSLLTEPHKPGSMLIQLCRLLDGVTFTTRLGSKTCSARYLGQLPEVALADRLVGQHCTLQEALTHMLDFVKEDRSLELLDNLSLNGNHFTLPTR